LGVLQHVGHLSLAPQDIHVFHRMALLRIGFPSRLRVRSTVLAVNNHPVHHIFNPRGNVFFSLFYTVSLLKDPRRRAWSSRRTAPLLNRVHLPAASDLVNEHRLVYSY
jgi:hypothetical protein